MVGVNAVIHILLVRKPHRVIKYLAQVKEPGWI